MKYTVDRIEDGIVTCEDGSENHINIQISLLPDGVKEGDIIEVCDGKFTVCKEETEERRKKMANLQKSIFTKRK